MLVIGIIHIWYFNKHYHHKCANNEKISENFKNLKDEYFHYSLALLKSVLILYFVDGILI